jgi:hypothetical protein
LSQNSTPTDLYEALKVQHQENSSAKEVIPESISFTCKDLQRAMYSACPQSWVTETWKLTGFLLINLVCGDS